MCNSTLREVDSPGRMGGEACAIPLPGTEQRQAQRVAERLRQESTGLCIRADNRGFGPTVSIGISEFLPLQDSIHQLLKRADGALYRAKREGRYQVVPHGVAV